MLQLMVRSAMCGNKARDGLVRARANPRASFVAIPYVSFFLARSHFLIQAAPLRCWRLEWG